MFSKRSVGIKCRCHNQISKDTTRNSMSIIQLNWNSNWTTSCKNRIVFRTLPSSVDVHNAENYPPHLLVVTNLDIQNIMFTFSKQTSQTNNCLFSKCTNHINPYCTLYIDEKEPGWISEVIWPKAISHEINAGLRIRGTRLDAIVKSHKQHFEINRFSHMIQSSPSTTKTTMYSKSSHSFTTIFIAYITNPVKSTNLSENSTWKQDRILASGLET